MKKVVLMFIICFLGFSFCEAENLVNINTATLAQLDELTGIGPKYAQAIIDNRPYASVDDLLRVKGIGEKTLAKIKEQGLACVNCETKIEENSENKPETEKTKTETNIYPAGILLNEVLSSSNGSDETGEWIEVFNSNNFEVDLSGWKIKDTAGTSKTFEISKKVPALGFLVFTRPETKITLNNDGDGLVLQNPNNEIIDSVEFSKSAKGVSFARFSSGWQQTNNPTPGSKNIESQKNSSKALSKTEKSVNNILEEDLTASLNQNVSKTNNPWFLFLTAVIITIISALIVLFIKIKFNKTNVRT